MVNAPVDAWRPDAPWPEQIDDRETLEEVLSRPGPAVVELMKRLEGDIALLGVGGKMGGSLALMARRAILAAGTDQRVFGVSRFTRAEVRDALEAQGVECITCDLLDRHAVAGLPRVANVLSLVGRKFGTGSNPGLTWATNCIAPDNICRHFGGSRIVAFSTGCVYPLIAAADVGSVEEDHPEPVGEYSQACLARERIHQYYSDHTPTCLFRLNYAIDLRYGVLHDIARHIRDDEPVDLSVGHFNVIWQGDADAYALLALEHCQSPAVALNATGPETVGVRYAATELAGAMGREVRFIGGPGGRAYLSNAARCFERFGYPRVTLRRMIRWVAHWVEMGGESYALPTKFQVTDGKF